MLNGVKHDSVFHWIANAVRDTVLTALDRSALIGGSVLRAFMVAKVALEAGVEIADRVVIVDVPQVDCAVIAGSEDIAFIGREIDTKDSRCMACKAPDLLPCLKILQPHGAVAAAAQEIAARWRHA